MRCITFILAPAMLLASSAVAGAAQAVAPSPVKMAVFPFELEDFSAAAAYVPPDDIDREKLRLSTEEARRLSRHPGATNWSTSARRTTRAAKAGKVPRLRGPRRQDRRRARSRSIDDRDRHVNHPNGIRGRLQDPRPPFGAPVGVKQTDQSLRGAGRHRRDTGIDGRPAGPARQPARARHAGSGGPLAAILETNAAVLPRFAASVRGSRRRAGGLTLGGEP